jgi:hypothetical protein
MNLHRLSLFILALFLFQGCVTDDFFGASSEKKILSFILQDQIGNSTINQDSLIIRTTIGASADITALRPQEVTLSTFAVLTPTTDIALDFKDPVKYTVTAEDNSTAVYTIIVKQEGAEPQLDNASFNNWYATPKGYMEPGVDANSTIWATGNAGTVTLGDPNVTPVTINGDNKAAKLETLDLGGLAGLIGQRMAAGSLFTGKFELDVANPLNSTKFGISFSARPEKFSVEYAYSPGSPYLSKNGTVLAKTDSCDIYVLLENREGAEVKRVATGWFRSGEEKIDKFYTTTVDLAYGPLGATIPDYQKPSNGLYASANEKVTHLTVVFSSSYNGALFEGGTNSTLVINEFNFIY